jgi:hypothetical protein
MKYIIFPHLERELRRFAEGYIVGISQSFAGIWKKIPESCSPAEFDKKEIALKPLDEQQYLPAVNTFVSYCYKKICKKIKFIYVFGFSALTFWLFTYNSSSTLLFLWAAMKIIC